MLADEQLAKFNEVRQRAVLNKRLYLTLDQFLSDSRLKRAIRADPAAWENDGPLTLAGCLASKLQEPCPPVQICRALDENLRVLHAAEAIRRPVKLMDKLLNNANQFLNTLSELALASTLKSKGWHVHLEEPFFGDKDVDVLAMRGVTKKYIEVTNLSIEKNPPIKKEGRGVVHSGQIGPSADKDLIVQKIAAKYQEKFEEAIQNGWTGHAWVALDVAKDHIESVDTFFQSHIRLPQWKNELTAIVRRECPGMSGFVVFRSWYSATHVDLDLWCSL
ncbi:MAG: hypothetical protein WD425_01880 [Nitrospirales bacterium]